MPAATRLALTITHCCGRQSALVLCAIVATTSAFVGSTTYALASLSVWCCFRTEWRPSYGCSSPSGACRRLLACIQRFVGSQWLGCASGVATDSMIDQCSCAGWTRNGNFLYQLFTTKVSAGVASANCQALGAELTSITSSGENAFLKALLDVEGFNQVGIDNA